MKQKKSSIIIKNLNRNTFFILGTLIILPIFLFAFSGCGDKDDEGDIKADFSYNFVNDNLVEFSNTSEGDYYSLTWDFGNNITETTTEKKKSFEIYYPEAGDYDVSLKVLDYVGNTNSATKIITITSSDLTVSFTTEIIGSFPNYVNLENTTQGEYDSFKWIYRDLEVENEMEYSAYFPIAGNYDIELQVSKNNEIYSATETITIAQDDPDYIENMILVWSDEFEGTAINTSNWTFETGATGWGNNELQNYTNGDNATLSDGKLIITTNKVDDNETVGSYTSTRMITSGKQEFQYGRIEIKAKLPSGRGIWPAIWMLGSNFGSAGWPACGEMDIMEYVGYDPNTIHSTVHTPSGFGENGNGSSVTLTTCEEEFHVYGLIWNDQELIFYIDEPENVTHTYSPSTQNDDTWPFNQSAFFILNVAVGGNWGGVQGIDNSIFPQTMEIDYVRVYQETQ